MLWLLFVQLYRSSSSLLLLIVIAGCSILCLAEICFADTLRIVKTSDGRLIEPAKKLDSLQRLLQQQALPDTMQMDVLVELALESYNDNPSKAKEYCQRIVGLATRISTPLSSARVAFIRGIMAWHENLYDEALQRFVEAARQFENLDLPRDIARVYTSIGNVHLRTGRFERALEYYEKSLVLARQSGDSDRIATNLTVRAQVYRLKDKDYKRAIADLQQSRVLHERCGNWTRLAVATNILGTVHDDAGEPEQALRYHKEALRLLRILGNQNSIVETLVDVSASLNALGRYQESLPFVLEAVQMSTTFNARHINMYVYSTLAATYAGLGRFADAYRAQTHALYLKDTVFSKERSEAIAKMQAQYDLERKDAVLRQQRDALEEQTRLRNLGIAGAVLCAAIAAVMTALYRAKQRAEQELSQTNHALYASNKALEQSNQQLSLLDKEKNEFLGIVVHDLKNPLSAILLAAEIVDRSVKTGRLEKVDQHTAAIRDTGRQMLESIKQLLHINAIEQGAWQLTIRPLEYELIEAVVTMHRPRAEAKQISLHYINDVLNSSAASTLPESIHDAGEYMIPCIVGDYEALRHVLDNLLSNAVKYSPAGKNIYVRVKSSNNAVRVEVQDEGPGISQEDMKKLFGKFARLSAQPTGGEHSTGLGLSIVKKLVEAMQGRVWCESELGKGATFIVELPASRKQEQQERAV
jgi:signal transduction histidine kinase